MPIVVEVLPEAEFDAWYASQVSTEVVKAESFGETFTHEQLMAKGEEVYGTYCVACHLADGQGIPPAFPAIAGSAVRSVRETIIFGWSLTESRVPPCRHLASNWTRSNWLQLYTFSAILSATMREIFLSPLTL